MAKSRKKIEKDSEEELEVEEIEKVVEDEEEEEFEELTTEERIVNIEKKVNQIFIISIIALIVAVISMILLLVNNTGGEGKASTDNNAAQEQEVAENYSYDTSKFEAIKGTDIASLSKKETIVVMVGRQGCGYCAQFAPILTSVAAEYGVTVKYLDLYTLMDTSGNVIDEASLNAIGEIGGEGQWEGFATQYFGRTPQTMFIKNNKVIYGMAGAADAATTRQVFEAAGFKKK